jgi:V8-like Glu-specific endopeptidase
MSANEFPLDVIAHDIEVSTQELRIPSIQEIAQAEPKPFPSRPNAPTLTGVESLKSTPVPFFSSSTVATTSEKVPNINTYPFEAVGRLNFRWRGKRYFGTAWAVSPMGLITAAHNICDKEDGESWASIEEKDWSSDVVFNLRYSDGKAAETFRITKVYILRGWTEGGTTMYDLAACVTERVMDGVNPIPFAANFPLQENSAYTSIGYPGERLPGYDFNGQVMWESMGDYVEGVQDQHYTVGSILSRGASGGPWWVKINDTYCVNGLTSGGNDTTNTSPYFGEGLKRLYAKIK